MKKFIWKLRYSIYFYQRIGGNSLRDWRMCWDSACISCDDLDGMSMSPKESADEELSCWTE